MATNGAQALIDRAQIEQRAYELYLQRQGEYGSDLEDWLQAERELLARQDSDKTRNVEAIPEEVHTRSQRNRIESEQRSKSAKTGS
jgi:hypothetical protein